MKRGAWGRHMRRIFCAGAAVCLLLAGCVSKPPAPCYPLEIGTPSVLMVEGVRYVADTDVVLPTGPSIGKWGFVGETGAVIGTCGRDPEPGEKGGWDVWEIAGDGEGRFLLARPNRFVFGPYAQYFFVREDTALTPPEADTVSRIVLAADGREEEITDSDLIAALLEAAADGGEEAALGAGTDFTLTLYHRDYPFLAAKIEGKWSGAEGRACAFRLDSGRCVWAAIADA